MVPYTHPPTHYLKLGDNINIASFQPDQPDNRHQKTIHSFGAEWSKFATFTDAEIQRIGNEYFDLITDKHINKQSVVMDVGCGTGRWTKYLAPQVGFIEAVDPSDAVFSASRLLQNVPNVRVTQAGTDNLPFDDNSFDFVFCLGVLHHLPDATKALTNIAQKLKSKGHFLVYFYYNLDNRGFFYRLLFRVSNFFRRIISKLPFGLKAGVCEVIAALVYLPFALFARLVKAVTCGEGYKRLPLGYYADKSYYIMRNDALDRFGTPLENRFSKQEIKTMLEKAGFVDVNFSEKMPFWHAVAQKP